MHKMPMVCTHCEAPAMAFAPGTSAMMQDTAAGLIITNRPVKDQAWCIDHWRRAFASWDLFTQAGVAQ